MKRVYVDENIPYALEFFEGFGQVSTFAGRHLKQSDLSECDILIVRSVTRVDRTLLEGTPVQFVGTATAGTNHINQADLKSLGIPWASAAGCNAKAVSEYVLACLLNLYQLNQLSPLDPIGIVGYGNVGQALAHKLDALQIPYQVCDPLRAQTFQDVQYRSLSELNSCPLLTFHTPYTQSGDAPTHQMWNSKTAQGFIPGLHLINACRGEVFDEDFIIQERNRFGHIYADVFWDEPQPRLDYIESVQLATPHIAGYSLRGKLNGSAILVDKLNELFVTEVPVYQGAFLKRTVKMAYQGDLFTSLHLWLKAHYNPWDDHQDFISTLQSADRGSLFDGLRKNYPIRPEFEDISLELEGDFSESDHQTLLKMGFQILA